MKLSQGNPTAGTLQPCPTDLLPWYANGTLDGTEAMRVEDHLSTCVDCREDLAQCQALAAAVSQVPREPWQPSRAHFSKVLEALDAAPSRSFGWKAWIKDIYSRFFVEAAPSIRWVIAIQTALILALGVGMLWERNASTPQLYETLSQPPMNRPGNAATLHVVFSDDATLGQIHSLLSRVHGSIVEGPSTVGVYTIAILERDTSPERLEQALYEFRSHQWVRLAEAVH